MKKIMVCYDFSKNSEKALEIAVSWAQKFNSTIDLVFVDEHLANAGLYADIMLPDFEENSYKYREEQFNIRVSKLKDKYEQGDIVIKGNLLFGSPVAELLKFSKENSISFIIMGSQGVNFFSKFSLGSLASRLITKTHLPLLCVKQEMPVKLANILYAAELSKNETKSLEILKYVVDAFSSHLEIGHIVGPDTKLASVYEAKSEKVYNQLELKMNLAHQRALYKINELVEEWNFEDASTFVDDVVHENAAKKLLENIEDRDIDLFVLGSHSKNFWERIVQGSVSEYVLKRCSKSFLIIPNLETE